MSGVRSLLCVCVCVWTVLLQGSRVRACVCKMAECAVIRLVWKGPGTVLACQLVSRAIGVRWPGEEGRARYSSSEEEGGREVEIELREN